MSDQVKSRPATMRVPSLEVSRRNIIEQPQWRLTTWIDFALGAYLVPIGIDALHGHGCCKANGCDARDSGDLIGNLFCCCVTLRGSATSKSGMEICMVCR